MTCRPVLTAGLTALILVTVLWPRSLPVLFYNGSDSAPRGWYWRQPVTVLQVNDYVLMRLPSDAAQLAAERAYLPLHVPLLKRIAALPPQVICAQGARVQVLSGETALRLSHDAHGRSLPSWKGCMALRPGELFLLSEYGPASFDSRYLGPLPAQAVLGLALPLWTLRAPAGS